MSQKSSVAQGAEIVSQALMSDRRSCLQVAIAGAQNSRLGNGGSAHRTGGPSGYVDHGHHAGFDRQVFLAVGGYDERFTCNEDAEFDRRLIQSGQRIYMDGSLAVDYFPRTTLASLAFQYFRYGRGRARTVLKHSAVPRVRQLLPVFALLGCVGAIALSPLQPWLLVIPAAYAALCLSFGLVLAMQQRSVCMAAAGLAAMTMHMSWGAGFLRELTEWRQWQPRFPARSLSKQAVAP